MPQPIESSVIASYDISGSDLDITFKGGKTYRYAGAAHLAAGLRTASSAGQFFQSNIRGHFAFSQR